MDSARRTRLRVALVAAVFAAACTTALVPTSASADISYCNTLVAAYSECGASTGVNLWAANIATYDGGQYPVCAKTVRTTGIIEARVCATQQALADTWSQAYFGHQMIGYVGNNGPTTHTIRGGAWTINGFARASSPVAPTTQIASLPATVRNDVAALRGAGTRTEVNTLTTLNDQVSLRATTEGVCLTSTLGALTTCHKSAHATEGDLRAVSVCAPDLPDDQVVLYGLVPDGVEAVAITAKSGRVVEQSAVSVNTYRIPLAKADAADAQRVSWVGKTGGSPVQDLLPRDLGC